MGNSLGGEKVQSSYQVSRWSDVVLAWIACSVMVACWNYSVALAARLVPRRESGGLTNTVVSLIIAGIVFAIMFPIAMTQVIAANTSGWNSAVIVLFVTLFPVLLIIGVVLHLTGHL